MIVLHHSMLVEQALYKYMEGGADGKMERRQGVAREESYLARSKNEVWRLQPARGTEVLVSIEREGDQGLERLRCHPAHG